jgi:excisionase family DNA binding protein
MNFYNAVIADVCLPDTVDLFAAADNLLATSTEQRVSALTVKDVAELLNCSQGMVYLLARQKRIPALKIGSMLRFDPGTIAEWIRTKTTVV